jgi:1-acyl-sn-glycerol-3-phosphate acyltransferase
MRVMDWVIWNLGRVVALPLLYAPPLRMRRHGHEHLPASGPVLIVCNHVSVADPMVLMAAARSRRTSMMSKAELFRTPGFGFMLRRLRAFPIDRSKPADFGAIRHALGLLERGHAVVVFPEGHVSRSGRMRRGASGAGMFAQRPGVTVIPAVAWHTQRFKGPARVVFGPPIDMSDIAPGPRKARNREATDRIMAILARMVAEAGGPVQDPPVGPQRPIDKRRGIWFPPPEPEPELAQVSPRA